jgi:hypothetical protein
VHASILALLLAHRALCSIARFRSRRIAPGSRRLCRRSQRELRLRSLLRSTAARDPLLDCSLRSRRCSLGCRRLRRIWRNGRALFRHFLLQIGGANIGIRRFAAQLLRFTRRGSQL